MNKEAWDRFTARRRRITGDWLAGVVFGLGLGWISAAMAVAAVDPTRMITIGFITMFFGVCAKFLFDRDFWRGQFGPPA
jgi:F0F1-type ATP synthase assembly protein I